MRYTHTDLMEVYEDIMYNRPPSAEKLVSLLDEVAKLRNKIDELEEYKWMYEGLK